MSAPVIGVIFYSTYGHIGAMAEAVAKGVAATGATVKVYQIQETLPAEVLAKMYAGGSLSPKYPIITPNDLKELDGFLFGIPTRYGGAPAQVRAFFDQTGGLWGSGALVGKFGGIFSSTGGQHGGQETTALTTLPFFAHHGVCYVPIGYANPEMNKLDAIEGGSPYGASTISAGDGSRMPSPNELGVAEWQGKTFSEFVGTFVKGKNFLAKQAAAPIIAAKELPASAAVAEPTKEAGYAVEPTPAPVAAAPVAETKETGPTPAPTTTKPVAPKKKKGSFFGCCGADNID